MIATQAGVELVSVAYHRGSGTYRAQYDLDTTAPSMAVVASLSEVMDVDPIELEPLYTFVDTDALDTLLRVRDGADGDAAVTFDVAGFEVTIYSYGVVAIAPPDGDGSDGPNERVTHE